MHFSPGLDFALSVKLGVKVQTQQNVTISCHLAVTRSLTQGRKNWWVGSVTSHFYKSFLVLFLS